MHLDATRRSSARYSISFFPPKLSPIFLFLPVRWLVPSVSALSSRRLLCWMIVFVIRQQLLLLLFSACNFFLSLSLLRRPECAEASAGHPLVEALVHTAVETNASCQCELRGRDNGSRFTHSQVCRCECFGNHFRAEMFY